MSERSDLAENTRQHRLVAEVELPDFYCDDLIEILREFGWTEDGSDFDATKPSEALLHEVGDLDSGLLTVEISGEKDSIVERDVPILFRRAWIETSPPTEYTEDGLVERERERRAEEEAELADARATVAAFHKLVREHLPRHEAGAVCGAAIDAGLDAYDAVWSKHFPEA